jgi:hypothetical protein
MKELREEAKRSQKDKLDGYVKRAHGGRIPDSWEKSKKDQTLDEAEKKVGIEEGSKDDEKIDKIAMKHRASGGPIAGMGGGSKLGRKRGGKGGKTNVNIIVAGKGDGPSGPTAPPPALGSGPSPIPVGPKPMPSPNGPAIPPGGPMKRGGSVNKKHGEKGRKR